MRIDSANISMASSYSLIQQYEKSEELKMWVGDQDPRPSQDSQPQKDRISLSDEAKGHPARNQDISKTEGNVPRSRDLKFQLVKLLVEAFTGKKINLKHIEKIADKADAEKKDADIQKVEGDTRQTEDQGWAVVYNSSETYYEHQEMSFNAEGVIKTSDGHEIKFSLQLNMEQDFLSEKTINISAGDAVLTDPFIINYSGAAADLASSKFAFDLGVDSQNKDISLVLPGKGLLVLDKNNDGKVTDGSELFGPQTGNGFTELAAYDEDKNDWIDENDSIFAQLGIWTKGEGGKDHLSTLKEQNVGAIYLGNIYSPFNLNDSTDNLNGKIAATGIYLSEDGTPGTIQQVNIMV